MGLKAGLNYTPYQDNTVYDFYINGTFYFYGASGSSFSGTDRADFLMGLPDSDLLSPAQRAAPYPFDVDRARRLLTDNGWDVSTTPGVCVDPGTGPGQAGAGIERGDRLSFQMRYAQGHPTLDWVMDRLKQETPMTMGWCLDCHRNTEMALRPLDKVTDMAWQPPPNQAELGRRYKAERNIRSTSELTSCSTCHR